MHIHTVIVRIKESSPDLTVESTPILPPALIRCEQLWKDLGGRGSWPMDRWQFVQSAVEPLLYARIEPESEHYDNGLLNSKGPIQAQAIELVSCSFEDGPLPTISARAVFQMSFDRAFADTGELYDWMEATDWLDHALRFGFRLQDGGEWEAAHDHAGIDFEIVTL